MSQITDDIAKWPMLPGAVMTHGDSRDYTRALEARLRTADELLRAFAVSGIEHETRMYGLMQVDRNDLENARAYLAAREKER